MNTQDRVPDYFRRLRRLPDGRWIERARAAHAVKQRTYHMNLTEQARAVAIRQATEAVEQGHDLDVAIAAGIRMAETLRNDP